MKRKIILILGALMSISLVNEVNAQKITKKAEATKATRISRTKVVYKNPKTKVIAQRTLPNKREVVSKTGSKLYVSDNRFYRNYNGRYIRVAPRAGLRIGVLPRGYRTVVFSGRNYFLFDGIYYESIASEYEVVYPEIGTVIYELPEDYEKVEFDGEVLY
ncbi:MAG: hypothetical protein HKN31_01605 [Pricia sp.]|nr:hypothetical protein [Pricia sp.]